MQVQTSHIYKLSIDDVTEAIAQYMDTNYGEHIGDNFELIINRNFNSIGSNNEVIAHVEIHVKD